MAAVLPSVQAHASETTRELFAFLDAQGQGDYLGEAISQLEHSLQSAYRAVQAKADDETVLGALLHDVGRFIPQAGKMPKMIEPDGTYVGRASHERLGEAYLRQLGFSEKICQLVGSHVMAKRYLTAVDANYYDALSKTSKATLRHQGGPLTAEQVKEAQAAPWLESKLAVRRWDDEAKVAGLKVPGLDAYADMMTKSLIESRRSFILHGRTYSLPTRPTVAVCVDGFDPEYLEQGIKDGILPNLGQFVQSGYHATAHCTMPSFTNPNNCSIITGAPTSVHGIAGNFYLDSETGEEHMVLDDTLLRGSTILEQMSRRGVRVAVVTAKDKLRAILTHGLDLSKSLCFSAQYADKATLSANGIDDVEKYVGRPTPSQYSGDLSLFVMDAGVKLLRDHRADLFYLTLSDFIQHKHAPGSKEANEFLATLDSQIGQLVELGAVVGITGDHGMSDKCLADGTPNVLFLEDELEKQFGPRCARVICPITDPFVRHHGALGSFVRVHIAPQYSSQRAEMLEFTQSRPQVLMALEAKEACETFQMPLDREGDFVVVSIKNAVLGARKEEHDMANLKDHRLRSHGGLSEQAIPLISNKPLKQDQVAGATNRQWRNFDVFDLILNCVNE